MTIQTISASKLLIGIAGIMTMIAPGILARGSALLLAQAATSQIPSAQTTPAAQTQKAPAWVTAAGGKMSFEVASIREDPSGKYQPPPFSIDSDDSYTNASGLFTADLPLTSYISFAYNLDQMRNVLSNLPDWAKTKHFAINARAAGVPTKDQMRLMMQSLLADRFKLAIHFETQETKVLVMTLAKPGTLGPRLRLHADGPACDVVAPHAPGSTATLDMFRCNVIAAVDMPENVKFVGARNTTVELMAAFFNNIEHTRPIVDRTGIAGNIDFSMEYTPEPQQQRGAAPASPDGQAEVPGMTFEDAVKSQLGLKLEPTTAPLEIPVVDHVEMPSAN